jgi:hypothetical protein
MATRAASDGSHPSKVTCNGVCMYVFQCEPGYLAETMPRRRIVQPGSILARSCNGTLHVSLVEVSRSGICAIARGSEEM